MNTAGAIAQALAEAGIKKAFGLPGGEVLVLIDELRKAGVDFVLMRHEANAGIAAAVYGKLNRQPGVVIATLGPGAANLLLPIASAYLDQEPLLAITAQIPDDFPASHTHQLLPLHDTFRPMCRVVETITQSNAGDVIGQALAACIDRPYGVSYLTLSAREAVEAAADDRPQASRGAADAADGQPRGASGRSARAMRDGRTPAGARRPRRRARARPGPSALAGRVAAAVCGDTEGEGHRRRDQPEFRRRDQRHGRRRRAGRCAEPRRSADRLRTRSGRDRQDLACRARDPVGARSAQCDRRRYRATRRSSITCRSSRSCWPGRPPRTVESAVCASSSRSAATC